MAGQGSLCQQTQSARWNFIASRLGSTFIFAVLTSLAACQFVQAVEPDSSASAQNLLVENEAETLFYVPDSDIQFTATIRSMTQHASRRLHLRASLYRASDGEVVSTDRKIAPVDSNGNCEPMTFNLQAAEEPGVYEVRFDLSEDDDSLWTRFTKSKPSIVRIGRPIFIVPASPPEGKNITDASFRSALLHLPNLDWVNTMIDRTPYRPSSDKDFLASCDPHTTRAMKLWASTGRLGKYIDNNGMVGAILNADVFNQLQSHDHDLFPFASDVADGQHRLETIRELFGARGVRPKACSRRSRVDRPIAVERSHAIECGERDFQSWKPSASRRTCHRSGHQ